MIKRITLENFKGIRERVEIKLSPITLLFGANSSGKSTVVHALHYALEVLAHDNLDADHTTLGGHSIDLGGFRNLVHGHEIDRRIKLFFEFDTSTSLLADYSDGALDGAPKLDEDETYADIDDQLMSAWVALEIGWSLALNAPQVYVFEVGANGHEEPFARIEAGTTRSLPTTLTVNTNHPLLFDAGVNGTYTVGEEATPASYLAWLLESAVDVRPDGMATLSVFDQPSAIPRWRAPLRVWADPEEKIAIELAAARRIVSKVVVGIGELLVHRLEKLLYVGPLREVPPRNYRPPLTEDLARWAEGLGAWDALNRGGAKLAAATSRWMDRLGAGYRIELREVLEISTGLAAFQGILGSLVKDAGDSIAAESDDGKTSLLKDEIPLHITLEEAKILRHGLLALTQARKRQDLVLVDQKSGIVVRPNDVGVGISQVLPVIVAAIYRGERGAGSFVVIEQPELHIHPRLQVGLADLFIEQTAGGGNTDHSFLLETHSEHLVLRLLRRIRETSRGTLPEDVPEVHAQDVAILYVEQVEGGGVQIRPLRIDDDGEFLDVWPDGFFDERMKEVY